MSLWVKRTMQLLGVALLLASCEDDSFLLGFKNQKSKFKGIYQEITLGTSEVIALDSIITDVNVGTRLLVGQYTDNTLGDVRCESFAEFKPFITSLITSTATVQPYFDSIALELRLDFYSYGLESTSQEKFAVHRIIEDTLTYWKQYPDTVLWGRNRYYTESTIGYDPTPLGEASFKVVLDTLKKNAALSSGNDTLYARATLNAEFGKELFAVCLNDLDVLSSDKNFRSKFKGLAFVPTQSSSIIGFNSSSAALSKVRLYYHTEENGLNVDTLYRDFYFSGISFHNITPTRAGDFAMITEPNQGYTLPSGVRAVQSGYPLVPTIDLGQYYSFIDTLSSDVIINSAQLIVEPLGVTDGYHPIRALEMRFMRDDYLFYNYFKAEDSTFMGNFVDHNLSYAPFEEPVLFTSSGTYMAQSDLLTSTRSSSVAAGLAYNSTTNQYLANMTRFFQGLLERRDLLPAERLRNIALFPATSATGYSLPSIGKNVDRTIFNNNGVKLRIYYTRPTKTNQ